eukprot:14341670-Alexandrium_andersonii.AAC.1
MRFWGRWLCRCRFLRCLPLSPRRLRWLWSRSSAVNPQNRMVRLMAVPMASLEQAAHRPATRATVATRTSP